jgi:hypothetical protein
MGDPWQCRMGKSVLLAYTAAVLCSGYELHDFQGKVFTSKAADTLSKIGLKTDSNGGSIVVMAMSAKQLDNLV